MDSKKILPPPPGGGGRRPEGVCREPPPSLRDTSPRGRGEDLEVPARHSTATILTAGYGDRGFEGFMALLAKHGVTHFVDVRSVPQSSYWEDFRRPNLERLVPEAGLKYVWMGDTLGGVHNSPVLCKEPGKIPLEPLRATPEFRLGLDRLIRAANGESRVLCLVCGCKRPHRCHRSRLIGPAIVELGVEVLHIDERGELKPHSLVEAEDRGFQSELF